MLIIQKKSRLPLWIGIVFACILLLISFDKDKIKEEIFTINDKVMAFDLGFSRITQLGDGGIADGAVSFVMKLPSMLYEKLKGFPERPPLERLDLDIKFVDYQLILADRQKALNDGFRLESHEVKAIIRYQGKSYKARVRLKGMLEQHFRSSVSMSLNVSLKTKGTIQGFRKFSLQKPGARQFPFEQVFQSMVQETENLAVSHKFIRVFVNGESWGVMNVEESMTKEFLEKQRAKESLIFRLSSDEAGYYQALSSTESYHPYRLSNSRLYVSAYKSKKYLREPFYRKQYSYILDQRLKSERTIFDAKKITQAIALTAIWQNPHVFAFNNIRYYLNPYSLKLEIITSDQGELYDHQDFSVAEKKSLLRWLPEGLEATLDYKIFKDYLPHAMMKSQAALEKVPEIYAKYHRYFPFDKPVDLTALKSNYAFVNENLDEFYQLEPPVKKIAKTREVRPPTRAQLQELPIFVKAHHYDNGHIRLFNLLPIPVKIDAIFYNDKKLSVQETVLPGFYNQDYIDIETGIKGYQDNLITVQSSIGAQQRITKTGYSLSAHPFNPLLAETALPDFVKKMSSGAFKIPEGTWVVDHPIVLNGDVVIAAGAVLRFASDAYVIVKGAIQAEGTKENLVSLVADDAEKGWKGLYVFEAEKRSLLKHTLIQHTNALEDGILRLTGGVTFYKSDVDIVDSVIEHTQAEDALNIIKSEFEIRKSIVAETRSDAFDSDFASGLIIQSEFYHVGGDAVDFSGSEVAIVDNYIHHVKDKAVSGGEGSTLKITGGLFNQVGVGVASKDGSRVYASGVEIKDQTLSALMTYIKKDFFEEPVLIANDIKTGSQKIWSRQKGTTLRLDGVLVEEKELDVKALYQGEVMRK